MAFCSRCGVSIEGRFCSACGYDNQPQEKAQSVDDTISQLYSLRAGLSSVSVQTDTIRREEREGNKKINSQKNIIQSIENDIEDNYLTIRDQKNKINQDEKNQRENKTQKLEEEKNFLLQRATEERTKKIRENNIKKIAMVFFYGLGGAVALSGVAMGIAFIYLAFKYNYVSEKHSMLFAMMFGTPIIILAGVGLGWIAYSLFQKEIAKAIPDERKNIENSYNKKISEVKNLYYKCLTYKNNIPTLEQRVDELISENIQNNEQLVDIETEHKNKMQYYSACALATYNALVDEHASILDTRDWENLDLVIYYLETRRAISVREALQLVDRQHQTDAIVKSLRMATNQICDTIKVNTSIIQNTVVKCAGLIAEGLNDVCGRLNSIEVGQDITNNYLRNVSSQIAINNALQKKANVTSAQLMSDVKQMRVYADNAAIKSRNS